MKPATTGRFCELCNGEATLYCGSDSAFLCWNCDARVHEANFLVARHVRQTVCCKCDRLDGNRFSGVGFRPRRTICLSCYSDSDQDYDYDSSSTRSSSTCISTAESVSAGDFAPITKTATSFSTKRLRKPAKKIGCASSTVSDNSARDVSESPTVIGIAGEEVYQRPMRQRRRFPAKVDVKADVILRNWCRRMGLKNAGRCVPIASQVLSLCLRENQFAGLPSRVSLASSLWSAVKASEGQTASTWQNLRRLEAISGVPAKLILLAESKISRLVKINGGGCPDEEEGWAECSDQS